MKTGAIVLVIMFTFSTAVALPAEAQGRGPGKGRNKAGVGKVTGKKGGGMGGADHTIRSEMMDYLYPVHMVRRYAMDLKLSDGQVEKLRKIVNDVQSEVENLKWDVEKEAGKLVELVKKGASKNEVYAQMDAVLALENKIKKKHIGLLIVVRDILTKEQRSFLDKVKADFMRENRGRGKGGFHGPPGPPNGPGGMGGPHHGAPF